MTNLPAALSRDRALRLLGEMLRIRQFEARCAELYGAGSIRGFMHLYDGEEAIAVGVMQVLGPEDAIVSTYREHGHALARGIGMGTLMAELYGKRTGCSGGRGGSMHVFDARTRFCGGNAIVGGGLPIAVGLALADQMQDRPAVTMCLFGDGAVAEGEFHESMNLAALWRLPLLVVVENNGIAQSTPTTLSSIVPASSTTVVVSTPSFLSAWRMPIERGRRTSKRASHRYSRRCSVCPSQARAHGVSHRI